MFHFDIMTFFIHFVDKTLQPLFFISKLFLKIIILLYRKCLDVYINIPDRLF